MLYDYSASVIVKPKGFVIVNFLMLYLWFSKIADTGIVVFSVSIIVTWVLYKAFVLWLQKKIVYKMTPDFVQFC
jgi:hypothetical protein